ncbi:MAG: hypothetical protein IPI91_18290 [Flavobacteriales bacterium]|nr:hypothetical protein [Flavobacteriales bacterium]
MPNILVINGSTREASTNGLFIKAIIKLAADLAHFTVFPSIADLPQFNPDLDVDPAPFLYLISEPYLRLRMAYLSARRNMPWACRVL